MQKIRLRLTFQGERSPMKKLGLILAAAMFVGLTGCGNDSHAPSTLLTYVSRGSSDSYAPHLFTLNPTTKVSTAVAIPINSEAEYVSANSQATAVTYCYDGPNGVDIFSMGTDGTENELTSGADACESVFSPDGKTIAYVSYPEEGTYGIYTMNADGSNQQGLFLPTEDGAWFPQFSPDGKSVVFYLAAECGCDRDPQFRGPRQSLKGAPRSSWMQAHMNSHPQKSRVHGAVKSQVDPTTSGWYTMALTDSAPTLVYATENWWGPAVFTTDGKSILFTMYDGEANNIATVSLNGSGYTPLTTGTSADSFAPVSYDGFIFFNVTDDANSSWDIYVMSPSGTSQTLVSSTANTYENLIDAYWED
jgi:Tol biopolymer transport system component